MNGSFEGPLTKEQVPEIASLLSRSLSPVPEIQKACENALKDLEHRENFLSCLMEIVSQRDGIEYSCRWLASVYLKNVVARCWRTRLRGSISQEEKDRVKEGVLDYMYDPDDQIGIQIAVALSKIGRVEYPKEWPQLFDVLLQRIHLAQSQSDPTLVLKRSYLTLYLLLKELSSKRLAIDQKNFESLCIGLYGRIMPCWVEDVHRCAELVQRIAENGGDETIYTILSSILGRIVLQIKCMKRILVYGFPSDTKCLELSDGVRDISPFLVQTMSAWLDAEHICIQTNNNKIIDAFGLAIVKILKLLEGIQEKHCWAFAASGSLTPYLELLCREIVSPGILKTHEMNYTKELLSALFSVLKCPGYKGSSSSLIMTAGKARDQKSLLEKMAADVRPILTSFWSDNRDAKLLEFLVNKFFVFTHDELVLWEMDGESFHQDMEHAAKEETTRGRAEMLFNALLDSNNKDLCTILIRMIQQCNLESLDNRAQATISTTNQGTLHTTAVLHSLALGAYDLYEHIDFTDMLHRFILPIISSGSGIAAPLRRESLKLISYWVSKLKPQDRPSIYSSLISIFQEEDCVMYLMACTVLQALMEDWEFDVEQFRPFALNSVRLLISILSKVSEYESQLEVFSVLNLVIDHLQEKTIECAPMILHMIPDLWNGSEGQSLLRIQILLALQRLVHALGSNSTMTYQVVMPILKYLLDSYETDPSNILEDGIYLWIVVLRHVPEPMPDVVTPIESMLKIMQQSSEHILTGTRCISSVILLYGDHILERYGNEINRTLSTYVGTVKDKAMVDVIACLDTIIQACPRLGVQCVAGTLALLLIDIFKDEKGIVVVAPVITLICRITIKSSDQIAQLFQYACQTNETQVIDILNRKAETHHSHQSSLLHERLLACFLDLWLCRFDGIGQTGMRKIAALGLSSFLSMNVPIVTLRSNEMISHIISVWYELEGPEAETDPISLSFPIAGTGPRDDFIPVSVDLEEAEGESLRRQALFNQGPIVILKLGRHFQECMAKAMTMYGELLQRSVQDMGAKEKEMLDMMMQGV